MTSERGAGRITALGEAAALTGSRVQKLPSPVALAAPVGKIATFHPGSLAALVATLPALVALRESFPGSHLASFCRAPLLPLLQCFGAVDEARARPGGEISAQAALMARLHAQNYDIALSFSPGTNSMLLLWATGATTRAGFVPSRLEAFLTHRVEKKDALTASTALDLVEVVGARPKGQKALDFFRLSPEVLARADGIAANARIEAPFVVVAPNVGRTAKTARATRDAQAARWNAVCRELAARWPLVVAAPRAWPLERGQTPFPIGDISGKTDALTLAALVTRGALVVGDDAGALALARFLNAPTVSVEAETDVRRAVALKLGV